MPNSSKVCVVAETLKKIFVMFFRYLGIVPSQIKVLTNPFDDDAVLDLACNNQDGFIIIDCNATPEGIHCIMSIFVTGHKLNAQHSQCMDQD